MLPGGKSVLQTLINGKISVPPRPAGYLARPRLESRLDAWRDRRLVLVTAGAGFGKTSLLSAAAVACTRPVFWYALDEMDTDPAVMRDHLLAAVSGGEARGSRDADRDLAETVQRLRAHEGGSVIVIDDLQLAGDRSETLVYLERLVRYLPAGHTLVPASREPLDMSTMKLRTQGAVGELRAEDLAFRAEEAAALFAARRPETALDAELADLVIERTEGWAAGLEILLQSLDAPGPAGVREALSRLDAAGTGWFAYFAEEVLAQLPEALRDFLRRASLLPRLDGELCDVALDASGSARRLADLGRRNLFTISTGGARKGYRFHHLFRDVLLALQARDGTHEETRAIRRRAARLLESREAWDDAMLAHAEGGDPRAALKLLERHGEALLASGRHETLGRVIDLIPTAELKRRSRALAVLGRVQEARGELDAAVATYRRALSHAESGRRRVELMMSAARVMMRRSDFQPCINLCRKALRQPARIDAATRGRLLELIGCSLCDLGRLDEGEAHLLEAHETFRRARGEPEEIHAFYLLRSNIHYRRGDFRQAKDAARRALVVFRRRGDLRSVCHCLGVLAHLAGDACEVRESRELAGEGLRLAGSLDYPLMAGYCRHALGRCALATGDLESADEHFAAARRCGDRVGESGLLVLPLLGRAETAARAGRRHEALRLARDARQASLDKKLVYQRAQADLLMGALDRDRGRVRRHWREADADMRRIGMRFDLHRLLLARLAAGDVPAREAPARLVELIEGVAELGHEFLFTVLEPAQALVVLPMALRDEATAPEAARHLTEIGDGAVAALAPLLEDKDAEVRARAKATVERIGGAAARTVLDGEDAEADGAPLTIRALGPLEVEVDGRVLHFDDWRSKRALRLFQFLLVRRFRWVPRDEIIEALWPETDIDKGLNNLRQTLYVLRRTLAGPDGDARADRFARYRNEAVRLEPGEGYVYDVEDCEDLLREAEALWSKGESEAAVDPVLDAQRLYRGHFLAESPYEEFTVEEREHLRDRLLRDLGRLCGWYARREMWTPLVPLARRAVALDPYHEEFHRRLIEGLAGIGHRTEALEAYHQYETLMVRELDLLPSEALEGLAERIARGVPPIFSSDV